MRKAFLSKLHARRTGSVLIMVVALLVLLALMGTAWLASVRMDRSMSVNAMQSTDIDQIADGAANLAAGALVQGVTGHPAGNSAVTPTYRPAGSSATASTYLHADSDLPYFEDPTGNRYILHANEFLSARVPLKYPDGTIAWPAITAPLTRQAIGGVNSDYAAANVFESPWLGRQYSLRASHNGSAMIVPTYIQITEGQSGVQVYLPAFNIGGTLYLAADTDGDGVADAGLWRYARANGITYYAAVRMVDNNSAVNISTAYRPFDLRNANDPVGNFFPGNINLLSLLADPANTDSVADQIRRLNAARFQVDFGAYQDSNKWTMLDDNKTSRGQFSSPFEALWDQLGRRLDLPAPNGNSGSSNGGFFRAPGAEEIVRSAPGFVLAPFASPNDLTNRGALDSLLYGTLAVGPTLPYDRIRDGFYPDTKAGNTTVHLWFDQNFDYGMRTPTDTTAGNVGYSDRAGGGKLTDYFGFSRRPLLVTRNAVSQAIPLPQASAGYPLAPNGTSPIDSSLPLATKASLNTANFTELWRAYFLAMAANPSSNTDTTPFAGIADSSDNDPSNPYKGQDFSNNGTPISNNGENHYRMFRNCTRPNSVPANATNMLSPSSVLLLRAALAAENTESLREGAISGYSSVQTVTIPSAGGSAYTARLYGMRPQPFITEVYADNDAGSDPQGKGPNPHGYIAVELYNPTNRLLKLGGWKLAKLDRSTMTFTDVYTFPNSATISPRPADSTATAVNFVVVENYNQNGNPTGDYARYRPEAIDDVGKREALANAPGSLYPAEKLHEVCGGEMVLLRPGPLGGSAELKDWVPVDSFDLTSFPDLALIKQDGQVVGKLPDPLVTGLSVDATVWHYCRNCRNDEPFRCVYPGRYRVKSGSTTNSPRQQGTHFARWNTIKYVDNNDPTKGITYEVAKKGDRTKTLLDTTLNPTSRIVDTGFGYDSVSSYPRSEFVIQWGADGTPGPGQGSRVFPFGGFARNLDVLQVPFIGGYAIYNGNQLVEMNAVTMDAVAAEDTDTADDMKNVTAASTPGWTVAENIGRFLPLHVNTGDLVDDFNPRQNDRWRYRWARRVPDYLTVQAPWDDHLPDMPRNSSGGFNNVADTPNMPSTEYTPNNKAERVAGVEGLVNINTAPVPVLAAVPFLNWSNGNSQTPYQQWLDPSGPDERLAPVNDSGSPITLPATSPLYNRPIKNALTNLDVAEYIVYYRDVDDGTGRPHGPFTSIWDLYDVTAPDAGGTRYPLLHCLGNAILQARDPNPLDGDLTPISGSDHMRDPNLLRNDFEKQTLLLTRVSNLITTRSDVFTAYIMVQGWRNAGTSNPELVSQRRLGVIIDRSKVTATQRNPTILYVPLE